MLGCWRVMGWSHNLRLRGNVPVPTRADYCAHEGEDPLPDTMSNSLLYVR